MAGDPMTTAFKQIRFSGLLVLWLIALMVFAVRAPAFFTLANFTSVLRCSTLLPLVTLRQALGILTGGGGIALSAGGCGSRLGSAVASLRQEGTVACGA